jgi:hypothetical protein
VVIMFVVVVVVVVAGVRFERTSKHAQTERASPTRKPQRPAVEEESGKGQRTSREGNTTTALIATHASRARLKRAPPKPMRLESAWQCCCPEAHGRCAQTPHSPVTLRRGGPHSDGVRWRACTQGVRRA